MPDAGNDDTDWAIPVPDSDTEALAASTAAADTLTAVARDQPPVKERTGSPRMSAMTHLLRTGISPCPRSLADARR